MENSHDSTVREQMHVTLIPALTVLGLLLVSFADLPYAYYMLLRVATFAACVYYGFECWVKVHVAWIWVLAVFGILYNPLAPLHMARHDWEIINAATIAMFIALLGTLCWRRRKHNTSGTLPTSAGTIETQRVEHSSRVTIRAQILRMMIAKSAFAAGLNEPSRFDRYAFNGVQMAIRSGFITMASTDGHRFALIKRKWPTCDIGGELKALIPHKALIELHSLLSSSEREFVEFAKEGAALVFRLGSRLVKSNELGCQFKDYQDYKVALPDYERIERGLPKQYAKNVQIRTAELRAAVNRVGDGCSAIQMRFAKNKLQILPLGAESCASEEPILIEYSGDALSLGFNSHFVTEFLDATECEYVRIEFNDSQSAVKFMHVGLDEFEYFYIVMPLKLDIKANRNEGEESPSYQSEAKKKADIQARKIALIQEKLRSKYLSAGMREQLEDMLVKLGVERPVALREAVPELTGESHDDHLVQELSEIKAKDVLSKLDMRKLYGLYVKPTWGVIHGGNNSPKMRARIDELIARIKQKSVAVKGATQSPSANSPRAEGKKTRTIDLWTKDGIITVDVPEGMNVPERAESKRAVPNETSKLQNAGRTGGVSERNPVTDGGKTVGTSIRGVRPGGSTGRGVGGDAADSTKSKRGY